MDELTELSYIHLIRQLEEENRLLREEIIQLRKYLNKRKNESKIQKTASRCKNTDKST